MSQIRENLKNTYNLIASHFDATRKKPWPPVEKFIDNQSENTLLLDLAAGTGRHAVYAKKQGLNSIAGDFSISQLQEIKKKDSTIPRVLLDITDIPFKNNTFDSIIYIAALHHLDLEQKRIQSLKEATRILKTNQTILISVWALDQPRFKKKTTADGDIHYTWDNRYPRFYHLFRVDELKDLAEKANLTIISSTRVKDNIYVVARKVKL